MNYPICKPFESGKAAPGVSSALFIHIAKCAGTSVKQALAPLDNVYCRNMEGGLVHCQEGMEYRYRPVHELEPEWTFTIVRHPFARLASCWAIWNYRRIEGMTVDHAIYIASKDAFCDLGQDSLSSDFQLWLHTRPAIWCNIQQAELFRFENIEQEWVRIQHKLGVDNELPRENQGVPHQHYSEILTKVQRDRLAELYRQDLDFLGYEP